MPREATCYLAACKEVGKASTSHVALDPDSTMEVSAPGSSNRPLAANLATGA